MNRYHTTLTYLKNNNISYDLAIEAHDLLRAARGGEISGVSVEEHDYPQAQVKLVKILKLLESFSILFINSINSSSIFSSVL